MASVTAAAERVLVVGLDGATYDVLRPLVQLGVMPNLGRLMRDSACCDLQSVVPCVTPAAWSTFQTGADPLEHGVLDYRYYDHRSQAVLMNTTGRLRCPTMFEYLAVARAEVVSLALPMTWPVPGSVSGLVVGGIDSPSPAAAIQPYPHFAERLAEQGVAIGLHSIWQRRPTSLEEVSDRVDCTITSFRHQAQAARIADQMLDWRCMVVQFQALDAIQHRCWHLLGIEPSGASDHPWTSEVHRAFRALDQAVGELFELASKRNSAVFVVSDHGFGPFREKISVREVLRRRGLLAPATFGQRMQFRAMRNLWKVGRWARKTVHGRTSNSMRRTLGSLDSIDWRRTQAVALHGSMAGLVYLGTPARFGRGCVTTPAQHDQVLGETLAAFREVRHPETGEPLFDQVIDVREHLQDDPLERCLPDVMAMPAAGFHTRVKADRRPRLVPADPDMAGTHRPEGVLMVAAPGIEPGVRPAAHLRDVAPTILAMLGVPGGATMQGQALSEYWAEAPRPESRLPRPQVVAAVRGEMSAEEQALVEQRLQQLGYID